LADVFDTYAHPIKLVLSDLDGTITAEELGPLDCEGLHALMDYNLRAGRERVVPPLSMITGRPHSYLEAFCRFLATPLPSLFESGCGMHLAGRPLGKEYIFHPALSEEGVVDALERFRAWAEAELVAKRGAGFIIGKRYALSYAPSDCCSVDELLAIIETMPADLVPHFMISRSAAVADITPWPVDKAAGTDWLLGYCRRELGLDIDAANVVGVGDSFNDLTFLAKVGVGCAVANAAPAVKSRVAYVAPAESARGVAAIMGRVETLNRRLGYV
jgi:hypothetical protein